MVTIVGPSGTTAYKMTCLKQPPDYSGQKYCPHGWPL